MPQGKLVAVTGGKGGTGKSTIAVNLAVAISEEKRLLLADLDVEAPNDHVLLGVKLENEEPVNIMLPFIDYPACVKCGECAEVCDTGAILLSRDKTPLVVPRLCSGCRSCYFVCPTKAIVEGMRTIGYTYRTNVSLNGHGFTLVSGMLREGEEHTPPVVIAAKKRALSIKNVDMYLVDTAAGTSNTVSTAMDDAKLAIAVTEPTPLGAHDLDMILDVTERMGVEAWVVVNRQGIGPESIVEEVARRHGARIVARLPYSRDVVESYVSGKPLVAWNPSSETARELRRLAKTLVEVV